MPIKNLVLTNAVTKQRTWLFDQVGNDFYLLVYIIEDTTAVITQLKQKLSQTLPIKVLIIAGASVSKADYIDHTHVFCEHLQATHLTTYLIRPDQYVLARWDNIHEANVNATLSKFLLGEYDVAITS